MLAAFYDVAGAVIEMLEHKGRFQRAVSTQGFPSFVFVHNGLRGLGKPPSLMAKLNTGLKIAA